MEHAPPIWTRPRPSTTYTSAPSTSGPSTPSTLTGIEDGTREDYRRLYARTWSRILGKTPITLITRDDVARAVNDLSARYADKSVANAHGLLAAMMNAAVRDDMIDKSPCVGIRLPRSKGHETVEHRYLDHGEFEQLLVCIPEHWRPLILCLVGTGLRWGEASALTVGDVDLDNGTIRVKGRQAGLTPRPRIHDLRHTHVAWLIAANVSLPVIQARLGHESVTTTIHTYGHLLPDLQAAAANAASMALNGVATTVPMAIAS